MKLVRPFTGRVPARVNNLLPVEEKKEKEPEIERQGTYDPHVKIAMSSAVDLSRAADTLGAETLNPPTQEELL